MSVVGPREIPWQGVPDVFLAHGLWVVTQRRRQVMVITDEAFTEPASASSCPGCVRPGPRAASG